MRNLTAKSHYTKLKKVLKNDECGNNRILISSMVFAVDHIVHEEQCKGRTATKVIGNVSKKKQRHWELYQPAIARYSPVAV